MNNSSRSPSRPPAPPSSTGSAPAQQQHQHQHYQQQQQQQQQPPAGQGYSNAPLPRSGNGNNGQQPTKGQQQTERLYLCLPFVKAALVKGNFKTIVALPKCTSAAELLAPPSAGTAWLTQTGTPLFSDVDVNEWVAVNREYTLLALLRADMRYAGLWLTLALVWLSKWSTFSTT